MNDLLALGVRRSLIGGISNNVVRYKDSLIECKTLRAHQSEY